MEIYVKFNGVLKAKDEISVNIASWPDHLQSKILKYDSLEKKQQRIEGLELLQNAFASNELDAGRFNLDRIKYNSFGKPFINSEVDFSLSYCGNTTVLAFIKNGIVGTDIEKIKAVDFENYSFLFSDDERKFIQNSPSPDSAFFKLWTRKEAVTKALGMGAFLDFDSFEVLDDKIEIENKIIYISSKPAGDSHWVSVANDKEFFAFRNEF